MATLNHASSNTDSPAALEKVKVSTHPSQPSEKTLNMGSNKPKS